MTKDEKMFAAHLLDLANNAWQKGIIRYTGFLDLNEQNIYHMSSAELSFIRTELYGGYPFAERQILLMYPDAFCYMENPSDCAPVCALLIRPRNGSFASPLTHRDYLGAILATGIERSLIGDILVFEERAVVFVMQSIASFLKDELTQVGRNPVSVSDADPQTVSEYMPKIKEITGSVASGRLDNLIAFAFRLSRSKAQELIASSRVFVDGKLEESPARMPKEGSVISARGAGRFRFEGAGNTSRKGRIFITLGLYE